MPFTSKSNVPESPSFAESTPSDKRKKEADGILEKYNGSRVPIIVERSKKSSQTIPLIDKKKYLVPTTMTFGQFVLVIRKRIKLAPNQAIFLYVNNVNPPATMTMGQLYQEHKDETGYLFCIYSSESTFGN